MPTNINFVEKLDAGCDTQVSFNLPKTLSLGTVKKSFDNNGLSEAEGCSYLALNTLNQAGLLGKASLIVNPSSFSENALYADLPANSTLGDFAFTRATDAWRTNSQGLVQRTPWNLLRYSEQFDNAAWTPLASSVTVNSTTSPSGVTDAYTLTGNGTLNIHAITQAGNSTNGVTYTHSIYAKKNTNDFIQLVGTGSIYTSSTVYANFDLNNGVVGLVGAGTIATIQNIGNGWYRCTMTATATATTSGSFIYPCLITSATSARGEANTLSTSVFLWGAQLTEGSSALEYFPTTDRLDVPRIDYSLGGCPNILLEPQRTNLALQSSFFDSATWVKVGSSVTANSTTSPSGVQDADTFSGDGILGGHELRQTISFINGTTYTFSVYAKKNTNNFLQLIAGSAAFGLNVWANFDLNSGVVGTVASATTARIENVGNGWYRCVITGAASVTSTAFVVPFLISSATSARGESNTLSTSVFLWGAQLEAGAYATSYIPTTTASVTRNADTINRSNIFTNGLITAAGGTWFVELSNNVARTREGAFNGVIYLGDSSNSTTGNCFRFWGSTSSRFIIQKFISGAATSLFTTTTDTCKIAIKWNGSTADVFQNGVKVVSATTFTATALNFLEGGAQQLPAFINEMALFPTPLTDVECLLITS